jgi:hypothetical protein
LLLLERLTLAAAAALVALTARLALVHLAVQALLSFVMLTHFLRLLPQPGRQRLRSLVDTVFTNGLPRGASPSDERNNGALC